VAIIVSLSDQSLERCAKALREGNLVAFPTETVYGLGGNALDINALEKIFFAKGRPKSDPLIVHVSSLSQVESLTEMTSFQRQCFDIIGSEYWPGPLTLILKASHLVPSLVTAGKNSVAIRIPSGKTAQKLLKLVNIPIAAPSANSFGHVSPTHAQHVAADLGHIQDLIILDDGLMCDIGIESTILKITEENEILLLRPGAISSLQINKTLKAKGINVEIKVIKKIYDNKMDNHLMDSPGQLLTHYSPLIESFILLDNGDEKLKYDEFFNQYLSTSILIDFYAKNQNLKTQCLKYLDLSTSGSFLEASRNLFNYLRQAESTESAQFILLPNLNQTNIENIDAIFDRIYRAASGKFVKII